MVAIRVVPEQIRQGSTGVAAQAGTVRRAGGVAVAAASGSSAAVGPSSLADALRELATELDRCCQGLARAIDDGSAALRRSADTYVASDVEARVQRPFAQP